MKQLILTGAFVALLAFSPFHLALGLDCSLNNPGCLDPTFGGGTGKVMTNTDGAVPTAYDLDNAQDIAIQTDGKLVVAGTTTLSGSITAMVVLRYNADGTLDTGFGAGGAVITSFSSAGDRGYSVAIQADGNIVVAGFASSGSNRIFAVARYNGTDGSLDSTFGSGGKTTISFGNSKQTGDTEARSVAIQGDAKILVGGFAGASGALVRLNSNGSLDTTFGSGGKLTNSVSGPVVAVTLQSDGKILFGGRIRDGRKNGYDFAVARYNTNGSLDTQFGSSGIAMANFQGDDGIRALSVDAGNYIVAAGSTSSAGAASRNIAVARFTPSGQLDATFGTGGKVTTDVLGNWDDCYGVSVQLDGKIVTAGFGYDSSGVQSYYVLIRYNANGTLDGSFGSAGIVTTNLGGGTDNFAYGLAIQTDGKIVAAGTSGTTDSSAGMFVAIARYFP